MVSFKAFYNCAPCNIAAPAPRNDDIYAVKESSTWIFILGLFKTAIDFIITPSNLPCFRKHKAELYQLDPALTLICPNQALYDLLNKGGRYHNPQAIATYLEAIKTNNIVIANKLGDGISHTKGTLSEIYDRYKDSIQETNSKLFAIPYDNSGHIVNIIVDFDKRRIEYFDPKGASCNAPEAKKGDRDLRKEISDLSMKIFGAVRVLQNFKQYQTDHHNCGIWVAYHIRQRMDGYEAENIPLPENGIKAFAIEMAGVIQSKFPLVPADPNEPQQSPSSLIAIDDGLV